eukprot:CAMPEP_0202813288 /NCGR_PEP_ID=MMETSP1389-20130828/4693_1 /ASSEMBLY_ACC=CAM_ASM_000865 /TAXON_ID=302021 /ORGANISM="Rhodomonas sp., Strain CCMP768" /LENGTH=55 /DNA_ID=CAMNT_0049484847 /DNA_START=165 /DNA_END=329 /DNA_ORIENTATION=-
MCASPMRCFSVANLSSYPALFMAAILRAWEALMEAAAACVALVNMPNEVKFATEK